MSEKRLFSLTAGPAPLGPEDDIAWLWTAQPLLHIPSDTVLFSEFRVELRVDLLCWVAFYAAASAFGAAWGTVRGAVCHASVSLGVARLDVVYAFQRLALVAHTGEPLAPKALYELLEATWHTGVRYPLGWAAAVYAGHVL